MVVFLVIFIIMVSLYFYIKYKNLLAHNSYLKQQIHHRVKNNVQIAYSLISLQKRYLNDSVRSKELEDTQKRVAALCYVNKLFLTKGMDEKVVSSELFNNQCVDLIFRKHSDCKDFSGNMIKPLSSEYEFASIDLDRALPLSLLINEFLLVFFENKVLTNRFCSFFTCLNKGEFIVLLPESYEDLFLMSIKDPLHNRVINRLAQQLDLKIKINDKLITQQF